MKTFLIILLFLLFISCNSDITDSDDEILYNPEISITKNGDDIEIILYDYPNISGFQFDLTETKDIDIISMDASGGLSEEYEFFTDTSILNLRVLGLSLTETNIPAFSMESVILIKLQLETEGFGEIGFENVILSGENGLEIDIIVNEETISIP